MSSERSERTVWKRGTTYFQNRKPMITSQTIDQTMSYVAGSSGFWDSSPSAPAASSGIAFVIALSENEAGDEADQVEGLGECNAEEHGRTELTGQLGLTSGCFHVLGDDEAEADATTDRC